MKPRKTSTKPRRELFACPNCGADVDVGAAACRECGSDASTGWLDEATIQRAQVDGSGVYLDGGGDERPRASMDAWVRGTLRAAMWVPIAFFLVCAIGLVAGLFLGWPLCDWAGVGDFR